MDRLEQSERKIKINKKFQKEYNKEKQKEELKRKKNVIKEVEEFESSSESESEDEDGKLLTPALDKKFNELITKIRNNDPSLLSVKSPYFREQDLKNSKQNSKTTENKENTDSKTQQLNDIDKDKISGKDIENRKEKKKTITQVYTEHLLESKEKGKKKKKQKTYDENQSDLKNEFLKAVSNEENSLKTFEQLRDDEDQEFFTAVNTENSTNEKRTDNAASTFLNEFFKEEYWKDNNKSKNLPVLKKLAKDTDFSSEESDLEKQEEFEANYNFRFQEPGGNKITTHPRNQSTSVRKTTSKRKQQRDAKKLRLQAELEKKKKEVKKLKRIKQKEIQSKLESIKEIVGNTSVSFNEEDLENAFNQEEFDKKMAAIFNEEFYSNHENDRSIHGKSKKKVKKELKKREKELSKKFKEIEEKYNEISRINIDEKIGNPQSKFEYIKVKPKNYKMSMLDILNTDDKDLTQKISLKFLAPYRSDKDGEKWEIKNKNKNISKTDNKYLRSEKIVKKELKKRKKK